MDLNVLAYNLKRVMIIIGTEGLLKAMAAYKPSYYCPNEVPKRFIYDLTRYRG